MKSLLIFIFCTSIFQTIPAQGLKDLSLQGIIGTKLHTYAGPYGRDAREVVSSLLAGFEIQYKKWPAFTFTYLNDRTYTFHNIERVYPIQYYQSNLFKTIHGNYLGISYQRKNLKYGLGHYWSIVEHSTNFTFPYIDFTNRDIALTFALKTGRMEFEAVKLIRYFWVPGIRRPDLQYINIK